MGGSRKNRKKKSNDHSVANEVEELKDTSDSSKAPATSEAFDLEASTTLNELNSPLLLSSSSLEAASSSNDTKNPSQVLSPVPSPTLNSSSSMKKDSDFTTDANYFKLPVLDDESSQSFFDYYIVQKVQPGSIKGSMFTLTTAIVGAGTVAVPYAILQVGLILGPILFIVGAGLAYASMHLLILCCQWSQGESYRDLALASSSAGTGYRLARVTQFLICLNLCGTSVGYLVGAAELLPVIGIEIERRVALLLLTLIFILPLSVCRKLGALRFTSVFAIGCIAFVSTVAIAKYVKFQSIGISPTIAKAFETLPLFDARPHRVLTALPLIVFAYTCHPNILPLYLQLQRRSPKRMYKVLRRSLGMALSIYLALGMFVVFTFGTRTNANFLLNDYRNSTMMKIGTGAFALAIVITIPLFMQTLRGNITQMLCTDYTTLKTLPHVALSTSLVTIVLVIAVTTDNIAQVLGVLGATSNPMICYILPTVFFYKLGPASYNRLKAAAIILSSLLLLASVASLIIQITRPQVFKNI